MSTRANTKADPGQLESAFVGSLLRLASRSPQQPQKRRLPGTPIEASTL